MTLIIGIAGGTGSGKTTVVERIISELGEKNVSVIQHDAYYRDRRDLPLHQREKINFDHPDALETELLIRHLEQLKTGVSVEIPAYDFSNHIRLEETKTVEPRPAILVEGILVLAERGLRDLMDVMVFVDTDADVRLARRLVRDLADRDRSLEGVLEQYEKTVRLMHLEFVEPSKRWAHIIIPEGGHNAVGVGMLASRIRSLTETNGEEAS